MKNLFRFLLTTVILSFVSCGMLDGDTDNEPEAPQNPTPAESKIEISDYDKSINFTCDADERSISFFTYDDWTAAPINERADDWCHISPTAGAAGSATLRIAVTANDTPDERSASIRIQSGTASVIVVVTQKQHDALTVSQSKFEVGANGSDITVTVMANIEVEYSIDAAAAEWIHPSHSTGTRAMATSQFTFRVDPNPTDEKREGVITFYGNDLAETITVYQAKGETDSGKDDPGKEPEQPETPSIVVSTNNVALTAAAQSFEVTVSHNVDVSYEISSDGTSWLKHSRTRAMSTNTYVFDAKENTEVQERTATITFMNRESGTTEKVTVTQQGASPAIVLSKHTVDLSASKQSFTVTVSHNVDVKVSIPEEAAWLTCLQTRAMASDKYTFNVTENDDTQPRKAVITFSADGVSETVEVTQKGSSPSLVVSPRKVDVTAKAQTFTVELTHNVEVEISIPEEAAWLTQAGTRAKQTDQITFNVAENEETASRSAVITFTSTEGNLSTTVTVTQKSAASAIEVSANEVELPTEGDTFEIAVTANVQYSVTISSAAQSWLKRVQTRAMEQSTLVFEAAANTTSADREGTITIRSTKSPYVEQKVVVKQNHTTIFNTTPSSADLYYIGGRVEIGIETNVPKYSVSIPQAAASWVSVYSQPKGKVVLEISRNDSPQSRTGEIALTDIDGKTLATVTLKQQGVDASNNKIYYRTYDCKIFEPDVNTDFGNGVKVTGHAFDNGAGVITFNNDVTAIGYQAFQYSQITEIVLPQTIRSIGNRAFYATSSAGKNPSQLTGINIPRDVESIGELAFYYCSKLTEIHLPDNIVFIGDRAFEYCNGLKQINIPEGVSSLGKSAFNRCSSLNDIVIPKSMNRIEAGVFSYCSGLTNITIPTSVKYIDSSAFSNCRSLVKIDIPDSILEIGSSAFAYCSSLEKVDIPSGVISIGSSAFSHCSNMTRINIPESVTSIGGSAFWGCTSLNNVVIPKSITAIENSTFSGCTMLTDITIPGSVKTIGKSAFSGCTFAHITIPEGVETISDEVFSACKRLLDITLPESVKSVGNSAFVNCESLTDVVVKGSGKIMSRAFYNCNNLKNVTLSDNITSLGQYSFYNCTSLLNVKLGTGISTIDEQAFYGCRNLREITLPETLSTIGGRAFYGCISLQNIYCRAYIPPKLTYTYTNHFYEQFDVIHDDARIYVPSGYEEVYKTTAHWNVYIDIIRPYKF